MSDPPRPLGPEGRRVWDEWDGQVDVTDLLAVSELSDERAALRLRVLRDGAVGDRAALRQIDARIADLIEALRRAASWRKYAKTGGAK